MTPADDQQDLADFIAAFAALLLAEDERRSGEPEEDQDEGAETP